MASTRDERMLRLSKMAATEIALLKEGVSIEAFFSQTIDDALYQAIADRLDLADSFLATANRMRRARSDMHRATVGRYYYAMYHAFRAVAFQSKRGDDFQKHSDLANAIPGDFPNASVAQNDLKSARLTRNEADYDPYPASSNHFKAAVATLAPLASTYVVQARIYVRLKGNPYA